MSWAGWYAMEERLEDWNMLYYERFRECVNTWVEVVCVSFVSHWIRSHVFWGLGVVVVGRWKSFQSLPVMHCKPHPAMHCMSDPAKSRSIIS